MHPIRCLAATLWAALILLAPAATAAGRVSLAAGTASIVDEKGAVRQAAPRMRVREGETLVTGTDGEIQVVTDDQGLVAVRPDSRVKFEVYVADGGDGDRAEVRLLRGFLRAVTGWIGKTAPGSYKLRAGVATIGIRGTDYEVGLVEGDKVPAEGDGTYVKVNEGEVRLANPAGEVPVPAGRAAMASATRPAPPRALEKVPAVFRPTANEGVIERQKAALEAVRDERLRERREELRRGGGTSAARETCTGSPSPLDDLMEIVRAYEAGDASALERRLDPAMLGLQRFRDALTADLTKQKQIRLLVKDVTMQCGPGLATLQFSWEKRFLEVTTFQPGLFEGRATMLMHTGRGGWRLAGISGDNPFASSLGTLGELVFGPAFPLASVGATPTPVPVTVSVTDADLAGLGLLRVQVVTSAGDAETLSLPETSPGRFGVATLVVAAGSPVPGDGVVQLASGTSLELRYVDTRPGGNRPATVLTRTLRPTGAVALADTTPDPFGFPPVTQAVASSEVTSAIAVITGINAPATATITGGLFSVNGGPFTAAPAAILEGQTVAVRVTAAAAAGGQASATLVVGGVSGTFRVTTATAGADATPDPLAYAPVTNAVPGSSVDSAPALVTGINVPAAVTISGGTYSVNGGAFTGAAGTVTNGQSVVVRVVAPAANLATASATLTVGGVAATFTVTTAGVAVDTTPDPFTFRSLSGVTPGSLVSSAAVVVTGINAPAPVYVIGGEYSIAGRPFTTAAGTLTNGQSVQVRLVAPAAFSATGAVSLTIGGVAGTFTVTTLAGDTTPNPFTLRPVANALPGQPADSAPVFITGINAPTPVTVTGGTASVNGGPFLPVTTINNNDQLVVRVIASPVADGTGSATATVNVGGVVASFTATTGDGVPAAYAFPTVFTTQTGTPNCLLASSQFTTSAVTVTGITIPAAVTVAMSAVSPTAANAQVSVNGGPFTSGPTTIANGQTLVVRFNSVGAVLIGAVRATIDVGGVTANVVQNCR